MGSRYHMEDYYLVHKMNAGTLLAVMDGHGGSEVAEVCRDYLGPMWDLAVYKDANTNYAFDAALAKTIAQLDEITNEYHCGSTISLAFVPKDEEVAVVATLGDSPVIVRSPDSVCHISPSHNVRTNMEERYAAEQRGGIYRGGYIWNDTGDYGEGIQMSRCLGDTQFGLRLSREPAIETHRLGDFLLLASDGVFDPGHKNEMQAIADVVGMIDKGCDAQALVDRAVAIPTEDNATAILLRR
jgi:serine/threonine protein phosphatase PrpC